jgi:hypothetical protein
MLKSHVFMHQSKCNEHLNILMTCLNLLLPTTSSISMTRAAARVNSLVFFISQYALAYSQIHILVEFDQPT